MNTAALDRPRFARDRFDPLPGWDGRGGTDRKTGVEIEFGGLTERAAAELAQQELGGTLEEPAPQSFVVKGSDLGDLEIYLDTALRKKVSGQWARAGLDASRAVVPVELVTAPLTQDQLPRLETLMQALRQAGAIGTRGGMLLGFGLHLNPELADEGGADLPATGTAYAFLEEWFRQTDPLDMSRRVLPFTDRYRPALLDALAEDGPLPGLSGFMEIYLDHVHSRNHGLDLYPAIRFLDEPRFVARHGADSSVSARPTYHYRLPDCRLGDPDWTVAYEWNRWALVERVARMPDLLDALRADWRGRGWLRNRVRGGWADTVDGHLRDAGLIGADA